jgi:hypothetical protein
VNATSATLFGDTKEANKNQEIHEQGKAQQRSAEK